MIVVDVFVWVDWCDVLCCVA